MRLSLLATQLFLSLALLGACGPSADDVQAEIRNANTCTDASECANVGSYCPYGCNILVNKRSVNAIRMLVQDHQGTCAYDCVSLVSIACENQMCVGKLQ